MFPAFRQHRFFGFLAQRSEMIQLLIEPGRPLSESRFGQQSQPLIALFGLINAAAWQQACECRGRDRLP